MITNPISWSFKSCLNKSVAIGDSPVPPQVNGQISSNRNPLAYSAFCRARHGYVPGNSGKFREIPQFFTALALQRSHFQRFWRWNFSRKIFYRTFNNRMITSDALCPGDPSPPFSAVRTLCPSFSSSSQIFCNVSGLIDTS